MVSKRDLPPSKALEIYALAVVNFVCCHSYARTVTDDFEYVRRRSPTVPPKWMNEESPHPEKVSMANFMSSKGYKTGMAEESGGLEPYRHQKRNSTRMLDTQGFPPRPVIITDSPETVNTWNMGTWFPENATYHDAHHAVQELATSVASSSDSSIFGHPVYSLQATQDE